MGLLWASHCETVSGSPRCLWLNLTKTIAVTDSTIACFRMCNRGENNDEWQ